jgi:coenzyme F420-0:L-glutamate ligase/coenzyme F420-1:gamma-L-glutamate ligase
MSYVESGSGTEGMKKLETFGFSGLPIFKKGDDVGKEILKVVNLTGFKFTDGDVVVVAQKIVSKAEGRSVLLSTVTPSKEAIKLAEQTGKDSHLCQLILDESCKVLYTNGGAIITEHKIGYVNTSSGIDRSNSGSKSGDIAVLLPENPDKSASEIRQTIMNETKKEIAVIISDSFGRPWRKGSVGMAIGVSGMNPISVLDQEDLTGRRKKPEIATADELAASASLVMGETNEGIPVAVIRGARYIFASISSIKDLLRPSNEDQVW